MVMCGLCGRPVRGLYRRRLKDDTSVCIVCVEYVVLDGTARAAGYERSRRLKGYSLTERAL